MISFCIVFQSPTLSNLGGSTGPIGDLTATGTSIYQFTVEDQDDPNTCTVSNADFSITAVNAGTAGTQCKEQYKCC